MSNTTLKTFAQRGVLFGSAATLVVALFAPATFVFADALNPLTERSLTLSSGSPGWNFRDASGNATYAPPNSGANGQKTGNTFSFRVSSNSAIDQMTFQYCTTPAGECMGPGDNGFVSGDPEDDDAVRRTNAQAITGNFNTSDLKIVVDSGTNAEINGTFFTNHFNPATGQPLSTGNNNYDPDTVHPHMPSLAGTDGNFIVLTKATLGDNWAPDSTWTMAATVNQTALGGGAGSVASGTSTGQENFITLTRATNSSALSAGTYVKVIFFATNSTYITNPGSKEFFVKINTFLDSDIVDGGVTVANVMNRSIEIQTKVLETMDFSVGTVDPNTLDSTDPDGAGPNVSQFTTATGRAEHAVCDPIAKGMSTSTTTPNVLLLGNEIGEFSLRTDTTYSTHSYWRLSSNSSGGATVYYSGVTLSNTVGDQIRPVGKTAAAPTIGGEQFGLALDNGTDTVGVGPHLVSYARERTSGYLFQNGADNDAGSGVHATTTSAVGGNLSWHTPRLSPLDPKTDYAGGTGTVNVTSDGSGGFIYGNALSTTFAFDPDSNVIPTPIASGTQVLDCVTGKMRYIANIAATTPAGIYTTKINYIAAPQY